MRHQHCVQEFTIFMFLKPVSVPFLSSSFSNFHFFFFFTSNLSRFTCCPLSTNIFPLIFFLFANFLSSGLKSQIPQLDKCSACFNSHKRAKFAPFHIHSGTLQVNWRSVQNFCCAVDEKRYKSKFDVCRICLVACND